MPNPKHDKRSFDVHRTLPSRSAQPHSLRSRNTALEKIAEITPQEKRRGFSFKRGLASFLIIILLFVLTLGVWDAVSLSRASKKMFGSGNIFSLLLGRSLNNHGGRTNILLVGYSVDDPGHPGATLTDSIMLISLDSHSKSGYMLSIPRDLYVNIPGYGYSKINEAYQDGNWSSFSEDGYPSGGIGLLEKIVSGNFGIPIDYYALVNYAAFRDSVNAVGGITLNIQSDDPRGLYDPNISPVDGGPLKLPNGSVKLDGQTALNLARARGDAFGSYGFAQADFDRATHQRQLILALKEKTVSWKIILNPVKSGHLFDGLANNVKSDFDESDVLPVYSLFNKVSAGQLKSLSLRDFEGKNYLTDYGGALIPAAGINDYSDIQSALSDLNQ